MRCRHVIYSSTASPYSWSCFSTNSTTTRSSEMLFLCWRAESQNDALAVFNGIDFLQFVPSLMGVPEDTTPPWRCASFISYTRGWSKSGACNKLSRRHDGVCLGQKVLKLSLMGPSLVYAISHDKASLVMTMRTASCFPSNINLSVCWSDWAKKLSIGVEYWLETCTFRSPS